MKFSIWYNERLDFFSFLKKYKENISTVYFPMFYKIAWSWRSINNHTKNIREYYDKIKKLIIMCKLYWIESDLLLNSACDWINTWNKDYIDMLIKLIKPMYNYWLTTITLVDLSYIDKIKQEFPNIIICNSLNADWVKSLEDAINLKNIWVDLLTIDTDLNYNISLLKKIQSRTWLKIKIFINDSCISNCPFDRQHASLAAHFSEPDERIWEKWACWKIYKNNRRKFFRVPFIRPEDLYHYEFVDYFKLSTRDRDTNFIEKLLNIYINRNYDWNFLDILEVAFSEISDNELVYVDNKKLWKLWYFEDMIHCPKDCDSCKNCDKYFDD